MQAETKKTTLKTRLLGMAAAVVATMAIGLGADAQGQGALVIQGGTLVDGNGGAPVPNSVIVITGNRITAVGKAGQVQIPAGAKIVDATGKWITPGLIDSMAIGNWMYGEAYLHWGVTSAVMNAGRGEEGNAARDAINHGIYPGPRMFQTTIDASGKDLKSPDQAREVAKRNLAAGADVLGTDDGDAPPEVFAAYADEGHKAGKGVVMRCVGPGTRGKACVLAGADVMLHTGLLGVEMNKDPDKWKDYVGLPPDVYCDMDPAREKDMVKFLAAHNTAVVPNLIAADRGFSPHWQRVQDEDKHLFDDPDFRAYFPEYGMYDLWDSVEPVELTLTPDILSIRACGFKNHAKFLGDLVAAGGHVLASMDDSQSAPGLGVQQEMTALQEDAGFSPMHALQSATKWPAENFRLKDLGTIEVSKLADIDIVDGDPTKDIMNMRKIDTVIKDGAVIDHAYHAWYKGYLFADDMVGYDRAVVSNMPFFNALKDMAAKARGVPKPYMTVTAPNGHQVGILPGVADTRKGPHLGPLPNPNFSPTPGLQTMAPHTLIQGTGDTEVALTGINFVQHSVVYVNGQAVTTMIDGPTKLRFVMPHDVLANAGNFPIVVKNPAPAANADWGLTSNAAHMLVPFTFSASWVHAAAFNNNKD